MWRGFGSAEYHRGRFRGDTFLVGLMAHSVTCGGRELRTGKV